MILYLLSTADHMTGSSFGPGPSLTMLGTHTDPDRAQVPGLNLDTAPSRQLTCLPALFLAGGFETRD